MLAFILAFVLWAVLHSVTAAFSFKAAARRLSGERLFDAYYRLAYNLFAGLTLLPVLYLLVRSMPAVILWRIPWPWSPLALLLQAAGVAGVVLSLAQTDFWAFAGVEQVLDYGREGGSRARPSRLRTDGLYRLVRHPLYFFSLLALWFFPVMSLGLFLFNVVATLYFALGSLVEERKLEAVFGEAYRGYRGQTPWLFPWPRKPRPPAGRPPAGGPGW